MPRLSLLRVGLACFAFAAGYLVDANVGRIMQQGSVVQSAEAARYNRTVVRRPGGTYKRTVVRGPRGGVYKRTVVRGGGRVYPGVAARRVVRTGAYIGALPGGCAASTATVMSCGAAAASTTSPMAAATPSSGSERACSRPSPSGRGRSAWLVSVTP